MLITRITQIRKPENVRYIRLSFAGQQSQTVTFQSSRVTRGRNCATNSSSVALETLRQHSLPLLSGRLAFGSYQYHRLLRHPLLCVWTILQLAMAPCALRPRARLTWWDALCGDRRCSVLQSERVQQLARHPLQLLQLLQAFATPGLMSMIDEQTQTSELSIEYGMRAITRGLRHACLPYADLTSLVTFTVLSLRSTMGTPNGKRFGSYSFHLSHWLLTPQTPCLIPSPAL